MCEGDMLEIINARHTHGVANEIRIQSIKPWAGLRLLWEFSGKFGRVSIDTCSRSQVQLSGSEHLIYGSFLLP